MNIVFYIITGLVCPFIKFEITYKTKRHVLTKREHALNLKLMTLSIYADSGGCYAVVKRKKSKNQKKLKKVVDICWVWCYYNQVAAIRQRQKLKETLINTGFFKN